MRSPNFKITSILLVFSALITSCSMIGFSGKKMALTGPVIMDKYVKATGGVNAYDKLQNRHMKAEMVLQNMGVSLDIEMYAEKPDKVYTLATSEQTGDIEKGTDGIYYWEKTDMQGPRILEGAELEDTKREFYFDKFSDWRSLYKTAEFVGIDSVQGKSCYKVILTPKQGKLQEVFIAEDTMFMTKMRFEIQHQMGVVPVETFFFDYREIDGILIPYSTEIHVMGQIRKMKIGEIRHNIDLPENIFVLPNEIKALTKEHN